MKHKYHPVSVASIIDREGRARVEIIVLCPKHGELERISYIVHLDQELAALNNNGKPNYVKTN